jgi:hypothetical protein
VSASLPPCPVRAGVSLGGEGKPGPLDADTQYFAHALEDLPEDVRQQAIEIGVIQLAATIHTVANSEPDTVR